MGKGKTLFVTEAAMLHELSKGHSTLQVGGFVFQVILRGCIYTGPIEIGNGPA
jgi:hypothetical protein